MKDAINSPYFQAALVQSYQPPYQKIIYGALKRLHVDYGHPLREDLSQEARLALAKELARLQENGIPVFNNQVGPHLYRRVSWVIIDALCRYQRSRLLFINDGQAGWRTPDPASASNRHENHDLLEKLAAYLTPRQAEYLSWVMQDLSDHEIAWQMGISKQAVANIRARVIATARRLLRS